MRVEDKSTLKGADATPARAAGERSVIRPQADKVSLEGAKEVEAVVRSVQTNIGADRTARLKDLEAAITRGGYKPNAGQLAEKLVQAAELDALLRMIFGG